LPEPSPTPPKPLICESARPARRTSAAAFRCDPPAPDDPLLGFAPYLHKQPRRNAITPDRQRAFIAALAASGIVTQAARSIGVSLEALYNLRHRPGAEGFAAAWEMALDRGIARLEDCALERAILGEDRLIVRGGEVVACWKRFDTALMLFLLRQRRSSRYGNTMKDYSHLKPGHPVFDQMRREWAQQDTRDAAEVVESINRKLDQMRERRLAADDGQRDDGQQDEGGHDEGWHDEGWHDEGWHDGGYD